MMRHHVIAKYLELITSPRTPLSSLLVDPEAPLMCRCHPEYQCDCRNGYCHSSLDNVRMI